MWSARSVEDGNRTTIVVSGRRWELVVAPVSAWEYRDLPQRLLIYFLIGTAVVISCLLAAMMWFAMRARSEEHTSELQSLMRISYAVFCLKKKKRTMTT